MAKITSDMNKKNIHFTAKTTNGKKQMATKGIIQPSH